MNKDFIIIGAGGSGREIHQVVEDINEDVRTWNFLGFLDENKEIFGKEVHGFPILGGLEWLKKHPNTFIVNSIGNTAVRKKVINKILNIEHSKFATLIHPTAWVGNRTDIGMGTVLLAGALVSTDITIGNHVILNRNCTVGHDAIIEDFVTIAPSVNITGNTCLGSGCDLGAGCTVVNGASIGRWTIVGAGAVVTSDLPPDITAVGIPAKAIKKRQEGWHLKI